MDFLEYTSKQEKYYLMDGYALLNQKLKEGLVGSTSLVLQLLPLEEPFLRDKKVEKELSIHLINYLKKHERSIASKKMQWRILLQVYGKPQFLPKFSQAIKECLVFDFSEAFSWAGNNLGFQETNGLTLSLGFLNPKAFFALNSTKKKKVSRIFARSLIKEDIPWSEVPMFLKQDPSFLIEVSKNASLLLDYNEQIEFQKFLKAGGFDQDFKFLRQLKDDGYLALILADEGLKNTVRFWLMIAEKYEAYERDFTLQQTDYEDYFWQFIPETVRCNQTFRKRLKRVIPHFNPPS